MNGTVEALEAFRFNDAANTVYQFVWHELCDWYIELAKEAFFGDDAQARSGDTQEVLVHCLKTSYLLLHPFMPFITEELWSVLRTAVGAERPGPTRSWRRATRRSARWTRRRTGPSRRCSASSRRSATSAARWASPSRWRSARRPRSSVAVADAAVHALLVGGEDRRVARLAGLAQLEVRHAAATPRMAQSTVSVGPGFEVRIPLAGVIDLTVETARIDKELAKVDSDLALLERKLSNPSFVERAPAEVVDEGSGQGRGAPRRHARS